MGPYCKFCDRRCFTHFPQGTPQEVLTAYEGINIIATCSRGQQLEKERRGYCYDVIVAMIAAQKAQENTGKAAWEEPTELFAFDSETTDALGWTEDASQRVDGWIAARQGHPYPEAEQARAALLRAQTALNEARQAIQPMINRARHEAD